MLEKQKYNKITKVQKNHLLAKSTCSWVFRFVFALMQPVACFPHRCKKKKRKMKKKRNGFRKTSNCLSCSGTKFCKQTHSRKCWGGWRRSAEGGKSELDREAAPTQDGPPGDVKGESTPSKGNGIYQELRKLVIRIIIHH